MKKFLFLFMLIVLGGCSSAPSTTAQGYQKITPEDYLTLVEKQADFILVDVRSLEEYNEGHLNRATLIPLNTLSADANTLLPKLDQKIIVYCRSGNRSQDATQQLLGLGYTNVFDLGGLNAYPYDLVK